MSKLSDLLKGMVVEKKKEQPPKCSKSKTLVEKKNIDADNSSEEQKEDFEYDISDENLKKVRDSVVQIDMTGLTRKQIIIGMYGSIVDPTTGKRFVIPGIDFTSGDYTYKYAEMMRTLVDKPKEFEKIMNWE